MARRSKGTVRPKRRKSETRGVERLNLLDAAKASPYLGLNTPDSVIIDQVERNMRLGFPQVNLFTPNSTQVCMVGGGPSLEPTFDELLKQYMEGHKLVAMNGTYNWMLERNLRPSAFVMIDARESNTKFIGPPVPGCKYFLASQCHPKAFEMVRDREAYIFHASAHPVVEQMLNQYLHKQFFEVIGGSTVMLRAIWLMRMLGFQFQHLYGFDSCFMDEKGHAYEQEENTGEEVKRVYCAGKTFVCSQWHVSQAEDFMHFVQEHGDKYYLSVKGDGLINWILAKGAEFYVIDKSEETSHGS